MIVTNLWVSALVALGVVLIAFAIGVAKGMHRGIDVAWGLGFAAIAVTTFGLSAGHGELWHRLVPAVLTVVWGARLALHIYRRGRGHGEDPRYDKMLSKAGGNRNLYALRMIYLVQAAVMWFVSLPIQVIAYDQGGHTWWLAVGGVIWAIGFYFEAAGDFQLARFTRDPDNRGKVLDTGLWRYTRHPNYFGDATVWWGLWLLGALWWPGLATILSPLLMTYFLVAKTGKPLLEKGIEKRRPGYAEYVRRTSGFIPMPPRR